MANGKMLEELSAMLDSGGRIPLQAALRLTLAGMREILEQQNEIKVMVKANTDNWFMVLGRFVRKHKEVSLSVFVVVCAIIFLPHIGELVVLLQRFSEALLGWNPFF